MAKKGNHNRLIGFSYEHRFVASLKKKGMKRVKRHYGSMGATDVDWTDRKGQRHEAQLKFSTIAVPKISQKTMDALTRYAKMKKTKKIWLVCKVSRGEEKWMEIISDATK